jgi:cytoskeletal protein CcmA (bactofilin family)
MFSKSSKTALGAEPMVLTAEVGRRAPKVASLVAEDLAIDGGLSGEVELHIDGTVRGDVHVARLSIGETGSVEGSVHAESVDCRGRVVGSITAQQVRLYGAAHVDGDISHDQLTIETGAYFQGRSIKLPKAQPSLAAIEIPPVAAE